MILVTPASAICSSTQTRCSAKRAMMVPLWLGPLGRVLLMCQSCLGDWGGALNLVKCLLLKWNLTPAYSGQNLIWERLLTVYSIPLLTLPAAQRLREVGGDKVIAVKSPSKTFGIGKKRKMKFLNAVEFFFLKILIHLKS